MTVKLTVLCDNPAFLIRLVKEQIQKRLNNFKQKELPNKVFTLLIVGYLCKIKQSNKVHKGCVYSIVGINILSQREFHDFHTFFAAKNKSDRLIKSLFIQYPINLASFYLLENLAIIFLKLISRQKSLSSTLLTIIVLFILIFLMNHAFAFS